MWLISALWPKKQTNKQKNADQKRSNDCFKDTSFNVGANNVAINIKVDSDEFSLGGEKKMWKTCYGKQVHSES